MRDVWKVTIIRCYGSDSENKIIEKDVKYCGGFLKPEEIRLYATVVLAREGIDFMGTIRVRYLKL